MTVLSSFADDSLTVRKLAKPADLRGEPLLMISHAICQHRCIKPPLSDIADQPNVIFESSNNGPLCPLVAQGMGIAIIDPITAEAYISDGVEICRFKTVNSYDLKMIYPA